MHIKRKGLFIIIISIATVISLILAGFFIVRAVGMKHVMDRTDVQLPGRVKYQDKLYEYNDHIITFLIMGIDKGKETIEPYEKDDGGGGQADALFLAVMNTEEKTIEIISINRNAMTDISIYDKDGNYYATYNAQIALQHGYGDGKEMSCQYQLAAVQNLFYNIPIHGYAAVNTNAIPAINDTVGGVDVLVLEDLTAWDPTLVKDSQIHLMGESAYWYVKFRDSYIYDSINMRMTRQKQYLNNFIEAAKHAAKKNIFVVLDLYREISAQMTTDITPTEILYLTSLLPQYEFDETHFHTVAGETVMGEEFEEFYVDEAALLQMILDIFYIEAE
ncbi:MAG: LCP family protein [Lachnospiraceae bacterium]|nr:LCP family protein [Lachnospiraceae bacterium]